MGQRSDTTDDFPGPGGGSGPRAATLSYVARRTAVVALVGSFAYLTRPLWHGFVYSALYSPSGALVVGGGTVVALALWYLPPSRLESGSESTSTSDVSIEGTDPPFDEILDDGGTANRKLRLFAGSVAVLFALSLVVGGVGGALEQRTLAQQTMADATEVEEFPAANPDNPRVVPRGVADITTRGSVSYRQHRLGTSDIARRDDGSLVWTYPIQPDGLRNMLVENQRGVLLTDMTRVENRRTEAFETEFVHGEGMLLHRSADWNLKKTDYLVRYDDDPVEFSVDGTPYMYYAKTGHDWKLTPVPHTVPTWEGGALVHPDGEIEHLTPAEARDHEVLDGQRLYPVTLTRAEMSSLGYREGIINQLPVVGAHENEVEVAGLPDGVDNRQPFVIDLQGERMSYVTAMEPFGLDSRGLDEVWFADAETGEYTYFATDRETLTGPERAMGIARSQDSQTDWGDNFVVSEPVPVIVDEDLWWHIKVTPTDFTDVSRSVFVNADERNAVEIRDDEAVRAFLAGDIETDPGNESRDEDEQGDGGTDGTDEDVAYYILITDEDGNVVDRISVEPGQDATIVDPDDERVREDNATAG